MTSPTEKRRAPGMRPQQRRDMILRAALPLVAVHGAAVTTRQIAQAAGIGEGTIFRVYATKEELLEACVAEAMRPDNLLDAMGAIDLSQPLADRLIEALEIMRAHLERMGTVMGALHASGFIKERNSRSEPRDRDAGDREESMRLIRQALTALFAPDAPRLRVPADTAAGMLLGLSFTQPRGGGEADADSVVDVLLHGALKPETAETPKEKK